MLLLLSLWAVLTTHAHAMCISSRSCLFQSARLHDNVVYVPPAEIEPGIDTVRAAERGVASPLLSIRVEEEGSHQLASHRVRPGLTIFKEPYYVEAIGHCIGDDIFSMYAALFKWNLHDVPRDNVTVALPAQFEPDVTRMQNMVDLYKIVSSRDIYFVPRDADSDTFEFLLTGWQDISYSFNNENHGLPLIESFVDRARSALEVTTTPANPHTCAVVLINKDATHAANKHVVSNMASIEHALREHTACTVQQVSWPAVSVRDQVQIMQESNIAVSLPGTDIMNCIFMPSKSAIISTSRCAHGPCESSNEIIRWFDRFPHRQIYFFEHETHRDHLRWTGHDLHWNEMHVVEAVKKAHRHLVRASLADRMGG